VSRPRNAFGSARLAGKRSLIFSVKFWRAECGPNPCPRPPANTHIPSNPPVLGDLSLQVRWPRSWHLASQRLISSSAAIGFWSGSHSGMMTEAPPRMRTSTCRTPSFLAALITRFTSACVIAAGLPHPRPFQIRPCHRAPRNATLRIGSFTRRNATGDDPLLFSTISATGGWRSTRHHYGAPPLHGWCPTGRRISAR